MFHAVLDPVLLLPPELADTPARDWVIQTREWTEIASAGSVVTMSCPRTLHEKALGTWFEQREALIAGLAAEGSPFQHYELVIILEDLRGRLAPNALADHGEVALGSLEIQPAYVPTRLAADEVGVFEERLGELAMLSGETHSPAMALTEPSSWAGEPGKIQVRGEVALFVTGDVERDLVDESSEFVEEVIGCCSLSDVCNELLSHAGKLAEHPKMAVEAAARVRGIDSSQLQFTIGDGFVGSVIRMNYAREDGRARTCWRAMASIAAGRVAEVTALNAHPQRINEGPGAEPVTDVAGRTLMRGHLALGSPNAHRLYWWNGATPEFVGVAGHDDPPPI